MSNMFGKFTTDGLEEVGDRLGGPQLFDTDVYDAVVKAAYAGKASASNAQSITVLLDVGGKEFRETHWITNKNGENFYADKNDASKKQPLPGFTMINELCLVTTGVELSEQDVEDKVIKLYDFDTKKDVNTNVPMLVELIGKPVTVAIVRQIVDKQQKDASGTYVNTGQTREENVADKFFHTETGKTVTELRQKLDAEFKGKWAEKNKGVTRNRAKGSEGKAGAPGRPAAAGAAPGAAAKPRNTLFGKTDS